MSCSVRRYSSDSFMLSIEARGVELVELAGESLGDSLEIVGISIVSFGLGSLEGEELGSLEGEGLGSLEGEGLGSLEGEELGSLEGEGLGSLVGEGLGSLEGEGVSCLGAVSVCLGAGAGSGIGSGVLFSRTADGVGCVNLFCFGADTVSRMLS